MSSWQKFTDTFLKFLYLPQLLFETYLSYQLMSLEENVSLLLLNCCPLCPCALPGVFEPSLLLFHPHDTALAPLSRGQGWPVPHMAVLLHFTAKFHRALLDSWGGSCGEGFPKWHLMDNWDQKSDSLESVSNATQCYSVLVSKDFRGCSNGMVFPGDW